MMDVNKYWENLDVLIYSPTITTGISYDIPDHFQHIYIYLCDNSAGCL
jgi:hypothetical protein